MGRICKGTAVWDEKEPMFPTFSAHCSLIISVRNPISKRPTVPHGPEPRGRTDPHGDEGELEAAARAIEGGVATSSRRRDARGPRAFSPAPVKNRETFEVSWTSPVAHSPNLSGRVYE